MLVLLLCCMMKIVEFSTGKTMGVNARPSSGKQPQQKEQKQRRQRRHMRKRGKTMTEVGGLGVRGIAITPDSDCNSNHHGSTSYISNTSSQDIDFIQDNSDYQWFLDYGYRDGSGLNHHPSILSLPESYETNDINYYDTLAKNMDANLAEADMESFRTEDIHALLTNLPPICSDHLSQENNRQGECFASVSGSMMAKFDFDSSISPHSSSQGDDSTSMSIYKSELLFSPVKDVPPMLGQNFSVDSLDCDMMLTCQANKDNYTIAFEASTTMYSEDSDYHDNDKNDNLCGSSDNVNLKKHTNLKLVDSSMTQSDCGSLTTWSKLKKRNCSENQLRRHPSGNNNSNNNELNANTNLNECTIKSQSMPNLYKQKLKTLLLNSYIKQQNMANIDVKRKPVKVFDIQHQIQNSTSETTIDTTNDNTTNKQPNFSLVKLFMKQKSLSTEVMSTTMDQFSSTENCAVSQSDDSTSETKNTERIDMSIEQKFNESTSGRTYDLIVEEPEQEDLSRSESVEQLSESVSKIDSVTDSYEKNQDNNNGSCTEFKNRQNRDELASKSIQTSQFSEIINLKNSGNGGNKPLYRIIEPSFLSKLKQESEKLEKPVYVLYPNYCLPNLDFLNERQANFAEILLMPHDPPVINKNNSNNNVKKRPFSFNDIETLRKKGFNHIKDWDSLNFLLPQEYRKILADVPEISEHIKPKLRQQSKYRRRPMSCDYTILTTNSSSSSSTTTQPSSGYRGSSTILTDSSQNSPANQPTTNLNPLFVYRYDSVTSSEASLLVDRPKPITTAPPLPVRCVSLQQQPENLPPRPPLPKTILRRDLENKRYSLYETSEEDLTEERVYKRRSLQEPYYLTTRNKRLSETEDEGVDAGTTPTTTSSSSIEEQPAITTTTTTRQYRNFLSNITNDELLQLEEFLKISGISTSDDELTEENLVQLKSYVSRFLSLKMNQTEKSTRNFDKFTAPNNSPNVSAFLQQKNYHTKTLVDMPICEESEGSPSYSSPQTTPIHRVKSVNNLDEKRSLITDVTDSIEQIINHFSLATNQNDLNTLGDTTLNPYCGKLVLTKLCPAIYAILSDCLKPNLETSFGAINNSVWQVIEASSQQGLLTKALNELVMKINSEDILSEGLVKFNAFIFGLLNVRSLDAWLSYLRTRESIIKKHYDKDSILLMAQTNSNVRTLLDGLIDALQPLALLPFQLDLLFEYRQLHLSFKRMDSYQQQQQQQQSPVHKHPSSPIIDFDTIKLNKERPRSCVETGVTKPSFKLGDLTQASKKRWSGIALNSKLYLAYDKLVKDDEEYTDSLENPQQFNRHNNDDTDNGPESLDSNLSDEKPLNSRRFKKLQQKWENLSGPDNQQQVITPNKSKIPRPITSPVHKPSGIPVLISPSSKSNNKSLTKKSPVTTNFNVSYNKGGNRALQNKKTTATRTSRVDQMENNELQRHIPRPSSLPYKPISAQNTKTTSKLTPPRRAVSSSLNRKPLHKSNLPKTVRTLSHRVPSESGHLAYNEGERLKVILDVDDKWLLCSRGTQKGLVPRSAVIAADF